MDLQSFRTIVKEENEEIRAAIKTETELLVTKEIEKHSKEKVNPHTARCTDVKRTTAAMIWVVAAFAFLFIVAITVIIFK